MEPEIQPPAPDAQGDETGTTPDNEGDGPRFAHEEAPVLISLQRIFIGSRGLRAGWSVVSFIVLFLLLMIPLQVLFVRAHLVSHTHNPTASEGFFAELAAFLALLGAAYLVALMERRRLWDYNLAGPRRTGNFFAGLGVGFVALSALVAALAGGGWLHFGPVALSGVAILRYGVLWGAMFLLVGCVEEGLFRCYLQSTLTRGINFWWALGLVAAMCLDLVIRAKGNGVWGVYAIVLLGLGPCVWLYVKKQEKASFWYAAWVTSALFGFVHTGNNGENWIGIFSAAAIGFVFCVSIWATGSAWWAIGCHAGWDWAETYFYGTADSGLVPQGHLLTTSPAGNAFWSGGADGPEGSILILGVLLLLLAALVIYGRSKRGAPGSALAEQAAD